jgi:hypothetical protein
MIFTYLYMCLRGGKGGGERAREREGRKVRETKEVEMRKGRAENPIRNARKFNRWKYHHQVLTFATTTNPTLTKTTPL